MAKDRSDLMVTWLVLDRLEWIHWSSFLRSNETADEDKHEAVSPSGVDVMTQVFFWESSSVQE
jgi:hypothetical protein